MAMTKAKEERAIRAAKHHEKTMLELKEESRDSARRSLIFGGPDKTPVGKSGRGTVNIYMNTDTVSALINIYKEEKGKKIAILNFADYYKAGGLFLKGSGAQEESLCHESNLFDILSDDILSGYYAYNLKNKNRALYTDKAIYTPDVIFERDGMQYKADVITCAAVNHSLGIRYKMHSNEENSEVMQNRILFLKDICEEMEVDVLIAGAWGCGVFRQDPEEIAAMFKETFSGSCIETVIYAIPGKGKNSETFQKTFLENVEI